MLPSFFYNLLYSSLRSGAPDSSLSIPTTTSISQSTFPVTSTGASMSTSTSTSASTSGPHAGVIAGGVVGGFVVSALLLIVALAIYRRKNPFPEDGPLPPHHEIIDIVPGPSTPGSALAYTHVPSMPSLPFPQDMPDLYYVSLSFIPGSHYSTTLCIFLTLYVASRTARMHRRSHTVR